MTNIKFLKISRIEKIVSDYTLFCAILLSALVSTSEVRALETIVVSSWSNSENLFNQLADDFSKKYYKRTGRQVRVLIKTNGAISQVDLLKSRLKANIVSSESSGIVDEIVSETQKISPDWRSMFQNDACPYSSALVFVVRRGNPKKLVDWNDLSRPDAEVMFADPVLSGVGRYAYLAALAEARQRIKENNTGENMLEQFMTNRKLSHVGSQVIDYQFFHMGLGDVLITYESEAMNLIDRYGKERFEIVYPKYVILARFPVAEIQNPKESTSVNEDTNAFISYMYSAEGQEIISRNHFRNGVGEVIPTKDAESLPEIKFTTLRQSIETEWRYFLPNGAYSKKYNNDMKYMDN